MNDHPPATRSAGYLLLEERHRLGCTPHDVQSYVLARGTRRTETAAGRRTEYYIRTYWPGDGDFDHLEFALGYEGWHLGLLRKLLPRLGPEAMAAYVQGKPTSAYARRLWFLYEAFTGSRLDLPDVTQGNYVELADARDYYTGTPIRSPRHRVIMNLPGTPAFSPMVRRSKVLKAYEAKHLNKRCEKILSDIPSELYSRALQFLYTKETKSSYAIERETPDQKRALTFANALREASTRDYLQKRALVELQRSIVDPRFVNDGWRDTVNEQNYVGTTIAPNDEHVDFVPPKPADVPELMTDFLEASQRILAAGIPPVIAASAIAYPFVFLHPFSDGNGRIHRFLIHYVLSYLRFAPDGVVFPISATMLHRQRDYDASLETFSRLVVPLIEYKLDELGKMTVLNETRDLYRYPDCTRISESLFSFVAETIEKELPAEIQFLQGYDESRRLMRNVVDMPNRQADLFIRLCSQNKGKLSKTKRSLPEFLPLTDSEIVKLEKVIRTAFKLDSER